MAKISILAGTTSKLIDVFIQDNSVTTGAGLTGLTNGSSGLTWYYYREGAAASVQVTSIASMTLGTWTSKGFIVIDGTNMPGCYQLGVPDAALAGGAKSVLMVLQGATNMAELVLEIELTAVDNQDSVRGGMTALPNAAAGATNGLPLSVDSSGRVDVLKINGTSQTARDIGASVLLSAGTGTGQLDFTSGVVKANATQWLGGTIPAVNVTGVPIVDVKYLLGTIFSTPATAGIPDINVKNINNVAAATPGAAGGIFIAGTNAATTVTTSFTTTFTGNLTGSVASVTGAVGSVTGAVGSVTGITASDVGAIKTQTDKLAFTVANQIDANVLDWKSSTAPAMTGDAFARLGAPTGASVSADVAAVKGDTGTILTDVNSGAGAIYTRIGTPAGASIAADIAAVNAKTTNLPAAPAATGDAMTLTGVYDFAKGTVAMTESYAANGVAPSPAQAIYAIQQYLMDFSISGSSYTVKKLDNSTTAYVVTLNSATTPTAAART